MEIRLQEWTNVGAGDERLRGLNFDDHPQLRELAVLLGRSGRLDVQELREGLQINTTSFVGRIDLGVCSVVIEPKLSMGRFLSLLRFAYGFPKLDLYHSTRHHLGELGLVDLLVHQYVHEAGRIIQRGLRRFYKREVASLASPRGKLRFSGLAQGKGWSDAALECEFHDRNVDHDLNAALLFGLHLCGRLTTVRSYRNQARRLADRLVVEVSPRRMDATTILRLRNGLDRQSRHYGHALDLLLLMMNGSSVVLDEAEKRSVPIPGFLFDMNRFYQALLARFLNTFLPDHEVIEEQGLKGMYRYERLVNEPGRRPSQPRPDVVVRKGKQVVGVFDAKYRDIGEKGLPRDMLYQLSIYALSGLDPRKKSVILYPSEIGARADQLITINDPIAQLRIGEIVLRGLDLVALEEVINSADELQRRREGRIIAERIVYGEKLLD